HPPIPTLFPYTTLFRSEREFVQPSEARIHLHTPFLALQAAQCHFSRVGDSLANSAASTSALSNKGCSSILLRTFAVFIGVCNARSEEHTSELQSRENLV